jgi:hypothetical protein
MFSLKKLICHNTNNGNIGWKKIKRAYDSFGFKKKSDENKIIKE